MRAARRRPSPPRAGDPVDPVTPLVRSKGGELGVRTEIVPGLQSSLALWQLQLASELLFVGDAGETEPSRASRRRGIEWNNHYRATPWLLLDADFALLAGALHRRRPGRQLHPRLDRQGGVGRRDHRRPGSVVRPVPAALLRAAAADRGQLRLRSKSTTLAYLRVGYRISPNLRIALDVFNLFDRKASDIDYFYTSRLQGEPAAGIDDVHFHPVEPRRFRLTLTASF